MAERPTHKVLVLDDEPIGRALVVSVLQGDGHSVMGGQDPGEAAALRRQDPAGIVLVDLLLGVLEAVPRRGPLREGASEEAPPEDGYVILGPDLSSLPLVAVRDQGGEQVVFGVFGYVEKPVNPEQLLARISRLDLTEHAPAEPTGEIPQPPPRRAVSWTPSKEAGPAFEALPKALRTALVVDPDKQYRQYLTDLLSPANFTVYEALDGEEGLKTALVRRPWLILTEVNLPRLDGFEFCRRVRKHSLLRHTPLVFLSTWDEYRERYHGLSLGADDYFSKRTEPRELLIRLQITLKRYADVGTRGRKDTAMAGGIELIGAPGLLQMCHIGRFTGSLTVRVGAGRVQVRLRDGEILAAESGMTKGAEAIFELLTWNRGHFEFVPGDPGEGEGLKENFDFLLLEGCRRLDESQHALEEKGKVQ